MNSLVTTQPTRPRQGLPARRRRSLLPCLLLLLAATFPLGATQSHDTSPDSMVHQMPQVVLQIAVMLAATWLGGRLIRRLGLPMVLGQLVAGMVIGPFALGGVPLPGFAEGLFPTMAGAIPVSPMIYTLSTLASIILLFLSGLETDLNLFRRYAFKGGVVGLGGVVVSFGTGAWLTSLFAALPFGHPLCLFMGSLSVATSVGITASLLSAQRKIDSPEGTVILSAAVIDDILGIIVLAVVLGIASRMGPGGTVPAADNGTLVLDLVLITLKALGIWLAFTFLGLRFSRQLGTFMKLRFKDRSMLAVMALGLALLLAGIFEKAGLSMIIGAYVVGLSLSNTDLAYVIHSKLKTFSDFLVPVFFAVSGMMLDLHSLADPVVLGFGLLFTLVAVLAKLVGCGGLSLALGFNLMGALRIGWGMVPRGEVALIIASIGMGAGILDEKMFSIAIIMTMGSTVLAPPLLNRLLLSKKPGQAKAETEGARTETVVDFHSGDFLDLLVPRFLTEMERDGFFVIRIDHEEELYQLRRESVFISLTLEPDGKARFLSEDQHIPLFRTALYECLLAVADTAGHLKTSFSPEQMADDLQTLVTANQTPAFALQSFMNPNLVQLQLQSSTKEGVIKELIQLYVAQGLVTDPDQAYFDVMERERSMTTGLGHGVAIPHAKTNAVKTMHFAIGLKPDGLDYRSLDKQPARIIILILSPKQGYGPHLQLLATLAGRLSNDALRMAVLQARNRWQLMGLLENGPDNGTSGS